MNLEFRLINMEKRDARLIAAMDHAIFEACEAGRSPPTLIYHNWQPAVSIAKGQTINDINIDECERRGFAVVRMPSGGKAVIHYPNTEFTYSLFVPVNPAQRDLRKIYETYCGRIGAALASFGLPATVVNNNDIFVAEKKIAGNAQRMGRNISMQHGLILYELPDLHTMMRLMNPSLYPDSTVDELKSIMTSFRQHSTAGQDELQRVLTSHLLDGFSYRVGSLTNDERQRIEELKPHYANADDTEGKQVRGLCWLPAPAYKETKSAEVHV